MRAVQKILPLEATAVVVVDHGHQNSILPSLLASSVSLWDFKRPRFLLLRAAGRFFAPFWYLLIDSSVHRGLSLFSHKLVGLNERILKSTFFSFVRPAFVDSISTFHAVYFDKKGIDKEETFRASKSWHSTRVRIKRLTETNWPDLERVMGGG